MVLPSSEEEVDAFVLDFTDAFWQIPISPAEQKYFCAKGLINGKRKIIAFQRAAQGSSAAPTLWGRLAALVCRITQSLFKPDEVRLVCYVDDPLAALRGDEADRKLYAAIMVVWSALGFKLAFAKRAAGPDRHVDRGHATNRETWSKGVCQTIDYR